MNKIITLFLLLINISLITCMEESAAIRAKKTSCQAHYWHPLIADILNGDVELEVKKEYGHPGWTIEYNGEQKKARPLFFKYVLKLGEATFLFDPHHRYPEWRGEGTERVETFLRKNIGLVARNSDLPCLQRKIVDIAAKRIPGLAAEPGKIYFDVYAKTFMEEFKKYENYILSRLQKKDPSLFNPDKVTLAKGTPSTGNLRHFEME
jgi:hypothetical protein